MELKCECGKTVELVLESTEEFGDSTEELYEGKCDCGREFQTTVTIENKKNKEQSN